MRNPEWPGTQRTRSHVTDIYVTNAPNQSNIEINNESTVGESKNATCISINSCSLRTTLTFEFNAQCKYYIYLNENGKFL